MMWYYGGGAGWIGGLLMSLSMIAFWALVVLVVLWAVRSARVTRHVPHGPSPAIAILEERLARGEISVEEFNERKRTLEGGA